MTAATPTPDRKPYPWDRKPPAPSAPPAPPRPWDRPASQAQPSPAAAKPSALQPDLSQAERFLTLLDETAEFFTFQTFSDGKDRPDHDPLAAVRHGTLSQHADWLTAMNGKGAGVFVAANATDGRGRGHDNIIRIRALWVDDDTGQAPPLPIEPHLIVQTSPGKRQVYVLVDDMPREDFDAAQARMVSDYGSDKAAQGINRVLRLPGFWHVKDKAKPHLVSVIHESGTRPIPWAKLRSIIPPAERQTAPPPQDTQAAAVPITPGTVRDLRSALNSINPDDYQTWVSMGHALVELGNVGRELWLSWSQQSAKWRPQDAGKWSTFAGERTAYQAVFAEAQRQGWVNPMKGASAPPASEEQAAAHPPLTGPEVDKLLAWSARTGARLPDPEAIGIFHGPPDPKTGKKPPERLRVSIQEGRDWSAPWRKLLWTHGQAAFMREVDSYLPKRAAMVERENSRRMDQGQQPQDDLTADDLRAHAARWLPGILRLDVGEEEARALLARLPAESILATKPGENWRLVPVSELLTEPEPLRWLVRGYIQPDTLNLLFGDPVAGKSLLAIDWAASLATGQPWNGHAPEPAPVVYLAGEGFFGIKRRLFAWALARECLEELRAAPLVVSSAGASLTDEAHVSVVAAAIDEIAAAHGQPGLIVIDTLARNFGAADENSAADVGLFVRAADYLRTRYQAAVLVVHHSGHGDKGRSRGSSAIRGAVDAEFCLSADAEGVRTLTATKTKDAPPPPTLGMNLKVIDLPWQTEDGEPETSVVLQPDPGAADTPRRRKAPPSVALAFESLLACLDEAGEAPPDTWQPPDKFGPRPAIVAPLEAWREEFISRHTGDSDETKGRAFRRARVQLTSTHAVGVWRDAYWPRPDVAPWADLAALLSAANLCREMNKAGQSPDNRRTFSSCPDTDKGRTFAGQDDGCPDMSGHTPKGVSVCPPCPPVRQPHPGTRGEGAEVSP